MAQVVEARENPWVQTPVSPAPQKRTTKTMKKAKAVKIECYGFYFKCLPKTRVLKAWFPVDGVVRKW
jgi:hypothetical protein